MGNRKSTVIIHNDKYDQAMELYRHHNYNESFKLFITLLNDHNESDQLYINCKKKATRLVKKRKVNKQTQEWLKDQAKLNNKFARDLLVYMHRHGLVIKVYIITGNYLDRDNRDHDLRRSKQHRTKSDHNVLERSETGSKRRLTKKQNMRHLIRRSSVQNLTI